MKTTLPPGWAYDEIVRLHRARHPNASTRDPAGRFQAIVLAGGSGTRLRVLLRTVFGTTLPKQFCAFDGGPTLLQQTLRRLQRLCPPPRGTVLVPREHVSCAATQLSAYHDATVLDQPANCGTGIGLLRALVDVLVKRPDALVHVTPSDHGIGDSSRFATAMSSCLEEAERHARILLIGATPSGPQSDYGWIVAGEAQGGCHSVTRFVEKPATADAARLYESGASWSTMLLVATGRALLDLFERAIPRAVRMFLHHESLPKPERPRYFNAMYRGLGAVDLSRDILGGASNLLMRTLPREVEWTDLGTEARLHAWMHRGGAPALRRQAQPLRSVQGVRRPGSGTALAG